MRGHSVRKRRLPVTRLCMRVPGAAREWPCHRQYQWCRCQAVVVRQRTSSIHPGEEDERLLEEKRLPTTFSAFGGSSPSAEQSTPCVPPPDGGSRPCRPCGSTPCRSVGLDPSGAGRAQSLAAR